MAVTDGWYLDAWNVVDGKAFASWRGAETFDTAAPRRKGSVFLAAPYFEPEWTSRPSTAMAAWRLGFQPGLVDAEQREIVFESLEQVRELVRRGFMGGGGGGLDAIGVPSPLDGPEEPTPEELPSYFSERKDKRDDIRFEMTVPRNRVNRRVTRDQIRSLFGLRREALARFVYDSLFLLVAVPRPHLATAALVRRWQSAVITWSTVLALLTDDPSVASHALAQGALKSGNPRSAISHVAHLQGLASPRSSPSVDWLDLPRWIPVPRRWRDDAPWILSLGDSLCYSAASYSRNVRAFASDRDVIPVLAAAMSIAAIASGRELDLGVSFQLSLAAHRNELFDAASQWLGLNLPDDSLPPAAERALDEMLGQRIANYHRA